MQSIIYDLVTAATEGIRDVDLDGRPNRIFIDTVTMMGDLPQATAFTDFHGHSVNTL